MGLGYGDSAFYMTPGSTPSKLLMARLFRIVVPDLPHHVIQRGNGRQRTFFEDGDYVHHRDLFGQSCRTAGVTVWAWCLMPNYVHLILVPGDRDGLRPGLAVVERARAPFRRR